MLFAVFNFEEQPTGKSWEMFLCLGKRIVINLNREKSYVQVSAQVGLRIRVLDFSSTESGNWELSSVLQEIRSTALGT